MEVSTTTSSTVMDVRSAIPDSSSNTPILLLGFSKRSYNALIKIGYDTMGKLLGLDEESLEAIENLGKKSIKEIRMVQEEHYHQWLGIEYRIFRGGITQLESRPKLFPSN